MSLGDVMSATGLQVFAEAAFVLAAAAFGTVLVTVFLRRNRVPFERARFMPLEDGRGERGRFAELSSAPLNSRVSTGGGEP